MSTKHLASLDTDMQRPASEADARERGRYIRLALIPWPMQRLFWQVVMGALFLLGWEYLPRVHFISSHVRFLDAFFISSPVQVWSSLVGIVTGHNQNGITLWPYLWTTLKATLIGTSAGLLVGALFGLVFSNNLRLSEVVRPYLILANSVPRVAIIPIFVVMMGPTVGASVVSVIAVVFFIAFFNAFEGGVSIREPLIENAILLGARPFDVMRVIRLPMVLIWTFASIPNAISFGLVVAVTTELIAGIAGMGQLILNATANVQVALTFAIIVALSIVGLLLYGMAMAIRAKIVRWKA
jgi:NitT/TauT family transport system permease protein